MAREFKYMFVRRALLEQTTAVASGSKEMLAVKGSGSGCSAGESRSFFTSVLQRNKA